MINISGILKDSDVFNNKSIYGFIYITTNLLNGKKYIGQKKVGTTNYKNYLGSGVILKQSIAKNGLENFKRDIIDIAYSMNELNELEKHYINTNNAVKSDEFYNIAQGGDACDALVMINSRKVVCISNGRWFKSINDASEYAGLSKYQIKSSFKKVHTANFKNEALIFRPLQHVRLNKSVCRFCGKNFSYKKVRHCGFCNDIESSLYPINRKTHKEGVMCAYDAIKDNSVGVYDINKHIKDNLDLWLDKNGALIEKLYYEQEMGLRDIVKCLNTPIIKMNELKYFLKKEYGFIIPNFNYNKKKDIVGKCSTCGAHIVVRGNRKKYCDLCSSKYNK